jgi:hypothetical protein
MDSVRSIVRPLLTLSGWAFALWIATSDENLKTRMVDASIDLAFFWFGLRSGKEK